MYTDLTFIAKTNTNPDQPWELYDYHEMFSSIQENPGRILVEGQPGFGKTLFTHKLASDWANGQLSKPHFDFIFVIKLKHADPNDTIPETIVNQIRTLRDTDTSPDAISKILRCTKFEILLALDGLDEVDIEKHIHAKDVIQENTLMHPWLLVTVQPHLVNELKQHFHLIVQNRGFSFDALDSLLKKVSSNTGKDPIDIYKDAGMDHISHKLNVPEQHDWAELYFSPFLVHASLTLHIDTNTSIADHNMSKFFASLVRFILKTNKVTKHLTEKDIEHSLLQIMELAYKGLMQPENLIFAMEHLSNKHILKLGLLSEYESSNVYNTTRRIGPVFLLGCYQR